MTHAKPGNYEVSSIRILKIGSCPSLSNKSTLIYHIDCNAESEILFRVTANTGGGFFNDEWVSFNAIQGAFDLQPKDKPIGSLMLFPLFQGKSLNSPSFLLAVIKAEGLVKPVGDKKRGYERIDSAEFMAEIEKLIQSKVDLKIDDAKPAASRKKSAAKNQISPS